MQTININNLTVTQNHGNTILTENLVSGGKHSLYIAQVIAVEKGKYTFVQCDENYNDECASAYEGLAINGFYPTLQAAAEAAFVAMVKTIAELEVAFECQTLPNGAIFVAIEAIADAANQLLHTEIAAVAEADAMQYEAEQIAAENDGIDFVQVYIDGLPSDWASAEVARYCVDYFLDAELPINETITFNGKTLYLEETILDTCFAHGGGVWEFWANPAHPDEKSLLMIYLRTTPIKARKKPRYPQETDYCDYRDGGDGYTSENLVLDF